MLDFLQLYEIETWVIFIKYLRKELAQKARDLGDIQFKYVRENINTYF